MRIINSTHVSFESFHLFISFSLGQTCITFLSFCKFHEFAHSVTTNEITDHCSSLVHSTNEAAMLNVLQYYQWPNRCKWRKVHIYIFHHHRAAKVNLKLSIILYLPWCYISIELFSVIFQSYSCEYCVADTEVCETAPAINIYAWF